MEKEEQIVIVLLIMAISSLLIAYLCFSSGLGDSGSSTGTAQQYAPEARVGDKVYLEAELLSKRFTYVGEHLLLKVDCNSEVLTIFVPAETGAETLEESIKEGDLLSIKGVVTEYEGEREIKVGAKEDISIINSQ